jgi:hypothetical protein
MPAGVATTMFYRDKPLLRSLPFRRSGGPPPAPERQDVVNEAKATT